MHKKQDFNIEQMHLNQAYHQLNSYNSSYYNKSSKSSDDSFSYWGFLKLRIGFSILLLFFIIGCCKSFHSSELQKVSSVFSHINETDPYTQKFLDHLYLK